ncbi:hypothetical protein RUM43_012829 [Polyplax serrata]|uniref:Uncharacterized protein n=1 Tax=Polyplax serrata TaxID=468196 RepID=A0AAN8P2H8_POLSC
MKPNRPHVVTSTRQHIVVGWNSCDSLILKGINDNQIIPQESCDEKEKVQRWYLLERKDAVVGWCRAYIGFQTEAKVGPLTPGDYYEFRLKVKANRQESEWSDTLFAVTKDDVIPMDQLYRAVENGPVANLRKVLSQRMSCVDVPNRYGQTALKMAVSKNNTNFIGILVNHGADINTPEVGSGRTALMLAAAKGHVEALQLLLEKGSSWKTRDRNGCTAFNYAVDNSHLTIVELAVQEGVDLSTRDNCGWSPFMRGGIMTLFFSKKAINRDGYVAEFLYATATPAVAPLTDFYPFVFWYFAILVLRSSIEVLSFLLSRGSDPNECDSRGQTVLMQAVLSGRPEVVQLLIRYGATITARNLYGNSACDMARHSSNELIVKMVPRLNGDIGDETSTKSNKKLSKT